MPNPLAEYLLGQTIQHAAQHTTFYQSLYEHVDTSIKWRIADLWKLPIVDKSMVRSAGVSACADDVHCGYLQNTSGSTGEVFVLHRSEEEAAFIHRFFAELCCRAAIPRERPMMLALHVPSHGVPTAIPGHVFVVVQVITDARTASNTAQLLGRKYSIPGVSNQISMISGGITQMLLLTAYLLEKGFDFSDCAINLIEVTGEHLSGRCRELLERTWSATVVNRYSMSEQFGGATYCSRCEGFHFDPQVIPELVEPQSHDVLDGDGMGILLLTSLHPFVQLQPLIRYWTGDLFHRTNDCCFGPSYRYLGRDSHALRHPDDPSMLLISGSGLYDILDETPLVNRSRHALSVDISDHSTTGKPIASGQIQRRAQTAGYDISLNVEAVVNPALYPHCRENTSAELRHKILGRFDGLRSQVESGHCTLAVRLTHPGATAQLSAGGFEKQSSVWAVDGVQPVAVTPSEARRRGTTSCKTSVRG